MLIYSEQQATGLERLELLGDLLGVDVFDTKPLEMTRMGTLDEPIEIFTMVSDPTEETWTTRSIATYSDSTKKDMILIHRNLSESSDVPVSQLILTIPSGSAVTPQQRNTDAQSVDVVC